MDRVRYPFPTIEICIPDFANLRYVKVPESQNLKAIHRLCLNLVGTDVEIVLSEDLDFHPIFVYF